jgi:hypothetical protein
MGFEHESCMSPSTGPKAQLLRTKAMGLLYRAGVSDVEAGAAADGQGKHPSMWSCFAPTSLAELVC